MRPIDAEAKCKEAAGALNATLMASKLREYSRFGLPGGVTDGRGGSPPLPLLGTTDRQILSARLEYEQNLRHAALALEVCVRLQRFWCVPLDTETEKAEKLNDVKPGRPCSNLWCLHSCSGKKDDVLRNGRCPACAKYWKRSGIERPRELCDVTNAQLVPATGTEGIRP